MSPGRRPLLAAHRILVVGDVMLDRHIGGTVSRAAPESSAPVLQQVSEVLGLGGAGNVAENLAGLGAQVSLIGLVGEDWEGAQVRNRARSLGVQAHLLSIPGRPTTSKTRFLTGGQHLLRWDRESPEAVEDPEAVLNCVRPLLSQVAAVVLSDYAKGVLSDALLPELLALCLRHGLPVIVDPKRLDVQAYRGSALITPNLSEARRAAGLPLEAGISDLGWHLAGRSGAAVLLTQAEAGMTLFAGDAVHHQPALGGPALGVSGAGDAVVAAMAMVAAAGWPFEEGLPFAARVAQAAVAGPGVTPVKREEVLRALGGDPL